MDAIIKALSQAPLVAVIAFIWWQNRKDFLVEIERLQDRVHDKDEQIKEFTRVFDRLAFSLELLKDRLR